MSEDNFKACPFCGNEPKQASPCELECVWLGCPIYGVIISEEKWNTRQSPDVEGIYKITDLKKMGFTEIKDLLESQRDVIRICNKRLTDCKSKSPESKKIQEALGEINGKIRHWKGMWIDTDFESIAVNETNSLIKLKSILEGGE